MQVGGARPTIAATQREQSVERRRSVAAHGRHATPAAGAATGEGFGLPGEADDADGLFNGLAGCRRTNFAAGAARNLRADPQAQHFLPQHLREALHDVRAGDFPHEVQAAPVPSRRHFPLVQLLAGDAGRGFCEAPSEAGFDCPTAGHHHHPLLHRKSHHSTSRTQALDL